MPRFGQRRVKFIWGASKVIQARWRFGIYGYYQHAKGYADSGVVFSVRGLLVLALILSGLAYLGGATAIYLWLERGAHNHVTFTDTLLFPLRRAEIREKRGQAYIDEGIEDFKAKRWSEAEMKLRVGLSRYPQAVDARMTLAEFYALTQRRPQALRLMQDGLSAIPAYPGRRYLTAYFAYAYQGEEYGRVISAADGYLNGKAPLEPKERNWLLQQKVGAMLAEKRAEEALAILAQQPPDIYFNEQKVMALFALGRTAEAQQFLATWRATSGPTQQILRLQVRGYREAGDLAAMEKALEELRVMTPVDPTPYAYGIIQRAMAGDEKGAKASLDDYFLRFGGNPRSLQPLGQPLAEIGAVDLLQQFIDRLAAQGHDQRTALLLLVQAYLKKGEWAEAARNIARVRTMGPVSGGNASGLDLLETLVAVASNPAEGPQVQLLDQLSRQNFPLKNFRMIIETLIQAGRYEVALEVIASAERAYAGNASLDEFKSVARQGVEAQQAAAAAAKGPAVVKSILKEEDFFARVDTAMQERQWSEAAAALRDVQLAKPSWLEPRLPEVLSRQIRVSHELHDQLEMVLATKLLVAGTLAHVQTVVDYAVELHGQKETRDAVLLLKEVLRKVPNHGLARRLLEEWTKRPEPAAVAGVETAPAVTGDAAPGPASTEN